MKFNIFKTFDAFFRIVIIFLICLVWTRYFIKSLWVSLLITFVLTLIIDYLINTFKNKKHKNNSQKADEQAKINSYINSFVFNSDSFCIDFFYNLTKQKHNAIKKNKYILIQHPTKNIILYPYFIYRNFCADDLIDIYNKVKKLSVNRLIICTNNIENEVIKLANKLCLEIFVLDGKDTYFELLKKYNYYPPELKFIENKNKFKDLLSYALNKKRTKGYFISSILLLFSSFLVPYKLYYVIISTILLTLAFVSYINPKFNKHNKIELLS